MARWHFPDQSPDHFPIQQNQNLERKIQCIEVQAPNPGNNQQTTCERKVLKRTSSVVQKGKLVLSRVKSANERNHGADSSLHNIAIKCTRSLNVCVQIFANSF